MARKPKVPNQPSIAGADGRHYMNPAYYGFPDPDNRAAQILERTIEIRERSRAFQRETGSKRARLEQLKREGHQARISAYVEGSDEFPDVNERAALEEDLRELEERVRAARTATEILAEQLAAVQTENLEAWSKVLRER